MLSFENLTVYDFYEPDKTVFVKNTELKSLRDALLDVQSGVCPLTHQQIEEGNAVVDHKHTTEKQPLGVNGAGHIRGVLDFRANAFEGKVLKIYKRLGLSTMIPLPALLRNLAEYLERPPTHLVHPDEVPKTAKLQKASWKMLRRRYLKDNPGKTLDYPPSGKVTKKLQKLYDHYKIEPKFYSQ